MKILAFGFQKRVGKDTASRYALSHLRLAGVNSKKAAFADKLKEQVYELYSWAGVKHPTYYDIHEEERNSIIPALGMTVRQLWISHGNKCREVYDRVWIDYLLKSPSLNTDFLIISDLRFPTEIEAVRELGGKICFIKNPRIPHTSDAADDALLDYNGQDFTIFNDGGLNRLYDSTIEIVEKMRNDS